MPEVRPARLRNVMLAILLVAAPAAALADDVTDSVNEGLQYYKDGKYTEAANSLNYAAQLIQQKKGASLVSLLPEPLGGWSAEEAKSEAAAAAMFGGGITAERSYTKGDTSVKVEIVADSPMMQAVMMMLSNPMFATSDGGKLETVGGQKAIVKFDDTDKSGQIQVVVAGRFLVTIEGNQCTKDDMVGYAKAIDYAKLAALP